MAPEHCAPLNQFLFQIKTQTLFSFRCYAHAILVFIFYKYFAALPLTHPVPFKKDINVETLEYYRKMIMDYPR